MGTYEVNRAITVETRIGPWSDRLRLVWVILRGHRIRFVTHAATVTVTTPTNREQAGKK